MHERLWLSAEAKRLDGESARLWTKLPGLGAGTERRKRHGKGDVAPGKVCSGPGMRVDLQPSSIEKSSRMQACDALDGMIQLKRTHSRRPSAGRPSRPAKSGSV